MKEYTVEFMAGDPLMKVTIRVHTDSAGHALQKSLSLIHRKDRNTISKKIVVTYDTYNGRYSSLQAKLEYTVVHDAKKPSAVPGEFDIGFTITGPKE